MRQFTPSHDTNIPYFIERKGTGWAFYNRDYCNTISGVNVANDEAPETFSLPKELLPQLNGEEKEIGDLTTVRRIYLHDGSIYFGMDKDELLAYIHRIHLLVELGIDPLHQNWFTQILKKSSNIADSELELPAPSL